MMILTHKQIEEIAAAVTKDFNEFFFGKEANDVRIARATPIDQFAKDYLGLDVSFARLSRDGSICGLKAIPSQELFGTTMQNIVKQILFKEVAALEKLEMIPYHLLQNA